MKTIGIVAHSAEGAALCYLTACREGGAQLGPHMHPTIVMSSVPMALSMPGWETENHEDVAKFLSQGVEIVADGGKIDQRFSCAGGDDLDGQIGKTAFGFDDSRPPIAHIVDGHIVQRRPFVCG